MLRLPPWSPRRWIALGTALVVVAAGLVALVLLRGEERTRLEEAVALAPASTQRFSWTDWAAVRAAVGSDVDAESSAPEVEDFLLAAYDRDLSGTTGLGDTGAALQSTVGLSPASVDWELFAQGPDGALLALGLPDGYDVGALRDRLRELGYTEPDTADGVWQGGADLASRLGLTPELGALQIEEEDGVVYAADDFAYLEERAGEARGERDDPVAQAAAGVGEALSALVLAGDQACTELAMSDADSADQVRAAELVEEAGGVHPLTGLAMAAEPGGGVRVVLLLDGADQAREDADSRSTLAAGPAPGQGGTFPERFTLGEVTADGERLTMQLRPVEDWAVLSDLSDGPVLFASC